MADEFVLRKDKEYNKLVSYFNKNKDLEWNEWLEFEKIFEKLGKQGVAGLFKIKNKKRRYVFKLSQHINYLAQHETQVMEGLNEISTYCPHFCRGYGLFNCSVEPRHKKRSNPFDITSKYPIVKEVLLCEYMEDAVKLGTYIDDVNVNENVIFSAIKQVLMALVIAQKKKFTHYDLHSDNVMMKKCDDDVVFLYVIDEDNQFCVPTFGCYPVIIDFGFSYIDNLNDSPLWTSLAHTQVGFMSDRFDWVADPKLFLVTVSSELKGTRKTKKSKVLRKVVRNIFSPLKIDWESGWDSNKEHGAADDVTDMMDDFNKKSKLFEDYGHFCIDMIQSLIVLPLQDQDISDFKVSFKAFVREWIKIENEISNPFYNLYILKGVIDSARFVRPDYLSSNFREEALKKFKQDIYTKINEVSKFCIPKKINYELMLCSLIKFAQNCEGILSEIVTKRVDEKNKEYNKLPLQSIEQIYAALEVNLNDDYKYNDKTSVVVFDVKKQVTTSFRPSKTCITEINDIQPICRGTYIYDLYTKLGKN